MECLAANGYGQWTCSSDIGNNVAISGHDWLFSPNQNSVNSSQSWVMSSSGIQKGWFLLGNQIGKPSEKYDAADASHHPGCQPTGVVSGGTFNIINNSGTPNLFPVSQCKAVANLKGVVRYVGVDLNDRTKFMVEGLNTAPNTGATDDGQIDITLNGLPNPPLNRQVVKKPIYTYPTTTGIAGFISTGGNSVNLAGVIPGSGVWQDQFDIAIDEQNLYIVWCSPNSVTNNLEIWATVVDLEDGSVLSGYPAPVVVGSSDFKMPTVAANIRDGWSLSNYDVSWIHTGTVTVEHIVDDYYHSPPFVVNAETLSGMCGTTSQKSFPDPYTTGVRDSYTNALHARVLISSVPNTSVSLKHVVYVTTDQGLVGYGPLSWTCDLPTYIDGIVLDNPPMGVTKAVPRDFTPTNFTYGSTGVVDEPIIAFANPYDGYGTTYNQFHCMYQLMATISSANQKPLMIARDFDNGVPTSGTSDTRMWLNRDGGGYQGDVASHIGAVNQMGIHLHWRIGSDHFYARDVRLFDEDIEENTLVTNSCIIGDGTSHGGTSGALLEDGTKMTVWSDPNYGAVNGGSTTSGMYWQYPGTISSDGTFFAQANIGTLTYSTTGLDLTVGSSSGDQLANLFTMPVCHIATSVNSGTVTINPGSTWDYFGSTVEKNWKPNIGAGSTSIGVNLTGITNTPATLNIHGGATFWECYNFSSELSTINILHEPNINPIQDAATSTTCLVVDPENSCSHAFNETGINCPANGLLRVTTSASIDHSNVKSFIPVRDWVHSEGFEGPDAGSNHTIGNILTNVIMIITNQNAAGNSSRYSLHSTNNHYTNFQQFGNTSSDGAGAVILYDGRRCNDELAPDKVVFHLDVFKRIQFHAYTPGLAGLEITNSTIEDWDLFPIYVENGCAECTDNRCSTDNYADIRVENNTFENVLDVQIGGDCGGGGEMFDPAKGIIIRNFNTTGKFSVVNVNGNHFDFYTPASGNTLPSNFSVLIEAAIVFDNSTGNIMNNTITDCKHSGSTINGGLFEAGIRITSTAAVGTPTTFSYLCNNTVKNQKDGIGIRSDNSAGYVNLNTLDGNGYGYEFDDNDAPMLVHNSIINSTSDGLFVSGGGGLARAQPDLRGIHTTPPACSTCTVFLDFAANNNISNNGTHGQDAQILLADANQLVNLDRLPEPPGSTAWGSWSLNKIASGASGSAWLIKTANFVDPPPAANAATFAQIPDISNNNWGGITPGASPPLATTHFAVIYPVTPSVISPWVDSSGSFFCSGYSSGERAHPKNGNILSVASTDSERCVYLRGYENVSPNLDTSRARESYDSLREYVKLCGPKDCTVDQAFSSLSAVVQLMSNDTTRFDQFRMWLLSVLYISPNCPHFFCQAMGSVQRTYQYGEYKGTGTLAVENYMRKYHRECFATDSASLARENKHYSQDSLSLVQAGMDPTHLPPLDSIGLGIVLQHDAHLSVTPTIPSNYLVSFTTSPNPFNKETTLQFTLNRMTYITFAVYDELGRLVWGDGRGASLEAGMHTIHLDGKGLPSGTLYARISTGFGEVKTVKLVHEK